MSKPRIHNYVKGVHKNNAVVNLIFNSLEKYKLLSKMISTMDKVLIHGNLWFPCVNSPELAFCRVTGFITNTDIRFNKSKKCKDIQLIFRFYVSILYSRNLLRYNNYVHARQRKWNYDILKTLLSIISKFIQGLLYVF